MNEQLARALQTCIAEKTGRVSSVAHHRSIAGGSISQASYVRLEDKREYFVKYNTAAPTHLYTAELDGLRALAESGAIRVPRPLALGGGIDSIPRFLVLEWIEPGNHGRHFFERFGGSLATMHQQSTGSEFGFANDNFIGGTVQRNEWDSDWIRFWREKRLGFQLRLAQEKGVSCSRLLRLGEFLLDHLDEWISVPDEPPTLIHGDLWSGNFLVDSDGNAVLIDPAVYYGRREAELAMCMMFGGFSSAFFESYRGHWPLAEGADRRLEIYQLYHHLNHLNLFGKSYLPGCLSILEKFA